MPKIVWEGNRREWGEPHTGEALRENAVKLNTSDKPFTDSIPYMIPSMVICFAVVFLKSFFTRSMPFSPIFFLPAFVIGFLVALPLHELMHAICYPKEATVWVGLCLRKVAAYAISFHPISRRRYVIMSLAPALLGIIPLIVFIACPAECRTLMTLCIVPAFMGLISPAPDYMDIAAVMRQTKNTDMIQAANDGLYRTEQEGK